MTVLYMLINVGAWLVPFVFSFHRRIRFNKKFYAVFLAIIIVAIPFVIWDAAFTRAGFWGFNVEYLLGWSVYGLPVEEILFFFFIPFSCLFTYYVIDGAYREKLASFTRLTSVICLASSIILFVTALICYGRWYSFTSFLLGGVTLFCLAQFNPGYLVTAIFSFLVLQVPFFLVNGALTGMFTPEPVVWYHDKAIIGARAGTIPVEDFSYALVMIMANIALFERIARPRRAGRPGNVNYG